MPLFILKHKDITMVIRGKCATCVRSLAVFNAGPEGTMVWRDSSQSTCEILQENGKSQVIAVQSGKITEPDDE